MHSFCFSESKPCVKKEKKVFHGWSKPFMVFLGFTDWNHQFFAHISSHPIPMLHKQNSAWVECEVVEICSRNVHHKMCNKTMTVLCTMSLTSKSLYTGFSKHATHQECCKFNSHFIQQQTKLVWFSANICTSKWRHIQLFVSHMLNDKIDFNP